MSLSQTIAFRSCAICLFALLTLSSVAAAQAPVKLTPTFSVRTTYSDNVFLLSPNRETDRDAPTPGIVASGRFIDMESVSDVITTFSSSIRIKAPGLSGRRIEITPGVRYDYYARNSERRSVTTNISIAQSLAHGGRLRLAGWLTPSYFVKNYLSNATDLNSDGSISAGERTYMRGEYAQGGVSFDYRLRLAKATKKHPFGARLQLGVGYERRTYDAPFARRDRDGPTASTSLSFDLTRVVALKVNYAFASLSTDRSLEVLLLNETELGQDFNGNGVATDLKARALTPVDRSRYQHLAGATLQVKLGRLIRVAANYQFRQRRFRSDQQFDVAHRNRRDTRNSIGLDLKLRVVRGLNFDARGNFADQNTNRRGDPGSTGDISDYTKTRVNFGLSYAF